jgi:hypothetical protein
MKYESVNTQRDPNIVIPFIRKFGQDTWQRFRDHSNDNAGMFQSASPVIPQTFPGGGTDWPALSRYTQSVREERGYNPSSPILVQSGQLRDMASNPFRTWGWGQKSIRGKSATAPYGEHTSLSMVGQINNGNFSASISGERVKNQTAYYTRRGDQRVGVPPRPFWGMETSLLERALPSAMQQFAKSWASRKPGTLR